MKKCTPLLFLFSLFISVGQLHAQCISGDCGNGMGIYLFPNGTKYTGQFQNNNISGVGSARYPDGSKYQGAWSAGLPNGYGIRVYPSGNQEKGSWQSGKLVNPTFQPPAGCVTGNCQNGVGIFIFPSGTTYMGEFANSEVNGLGSCYYINGNRYEGYWLHRLPEGKGLITYLNGQKQYGDWKNGQLAKVHSESEIEQFEYHKTVAGGANPSPSPSPSQTPQINMSNVDIQWGCLSGDCKNGKGTFLFMDGTRYDGEFLNGEMHGQGAAVMPDGTKSIGSFKNGLPDGKGKVYYSDGKTREGYWKHGEYIGTDPNAPRHEFEGCSMGNCQSGYGTYVFKDGTKYIGNFSNGQLYGKGMVIFPNGDRYFGEMVNGKFNGKGEMHKRGLPTERGIWKDNILVQNMSTEAYAAHPASNYSPPSSAPPPSNRVTTTPSAQSNNNQATKTDGVSAARKSIKVWAVIVGVADYHHAPVLSYTDDDSYRVYAFLRSAEGGGLKEDQITILIDSDATKNNITNTMRSVYQKADQDDLIFLYFSGHGIDGAFVPYDFDGSNNLLYHKDVKDILENSRAKYKMCVADACHSGSLFTARSLSASAENKLLNTFYETLAEAKAGTALIMSSKSEESSLESSGLRQGVFTHFLIRGLKGESDKNGDKIVDVSELFNYVYENVRSYTKRRQSPMIDGDYDPKMTVGVVSN